MGLLYKIKSAAAPTAKPLDIQAAKVISFQYSGFRNTNACPDVSALFLFCQGYEQGLSALVVDGKSAGVFSGDWCTALAHFDVAKGGITVSGSVDGVRWFTVGEVGHDDVDKVKKALAHGLPLLSIKASNKAYNASGYNVYYSIWPVYK